MDTLAYDPYDPQIIENPYPTYARLRSEDPCYYIERFDTWVLSRFEDIWQASTDDQHYTAAKGTTSSHLLTRVQPVTPMINLMDPPEHTTLRTSFAGFFRPGRVRKLAPQIEQFVEEAWRGVADKEVADLFNDFAARVSVKVACLANGFPLEDSDYCNDLVWRFFKRDPDTEGMTEDGLAASQELVQYCGELVKKRRASGADGDSVLDVVASVEFGGRKFNEDEAGSHLSMLIIGGTETFPKTFASTAHRLWQHKDQRAECIEDPKLIPDAYDEVLRYDMPTQFLMRVVTKELEIHGKKLTPGQPIMFLYPSANRDEREFQEPDRFDIHRRPARILTFGHGIHACIGRHFAKLEGRLCTEKLLSAAPDYEVLEDQLSRIQTEFVQGWEAMPARLRA